MWKYRPKGVGIICPQSQDCKLQPSSLRRTLVMFRSKAQHNPTRREGSLGPIALLSRTQENWVSHHLLACALVYLSVKNKQIKTKQKPWSFFYLPPLMPQNLPGEKWQREHWSQGSQKCLYVFCPLLLFLKKGENKEIAGTPFNCYWRMAEVLVVKGGQLGGPWTRETWTYPTLLALEP